MSGAEPGAEDAFMTMEPVSSTFVSLFMRRRLLSHDRTLASLPLRTEM